MQAKITVKRPTAAVEANGRLWMENPKGNLDAVENIPGSDLLMDEMVRSHVGYAEDISAELARFQAHCYADIAALEARLDQEFNISRDEGSKGNRTFVTYDGKLKVQIAISERLFFGPELQQAKALIDSMIRDRADGADPFLITLVQQAFKVDKEGQVDAASILALRRQDVDDPRWPDVCRAIDRAKRPAGSKSYLRFYRKNALGKDVMVPLNMATVEPTPEAFTRNSLRRQAKDAEAIFTMLREELARLGNLPGEDASIGDAVKWAVDYVVMDLQKADSTNELMNNLTNVIGGYASDELLGFAQSLAQTMQKVLRQAAMNLGDAEDTAQIDGLASQADRLADGITLLMCAAQ